MKTKKQPSSILPWAILSVAYLIGAAYLAFWVWHMTPGDFTDGPWWATPTDIVATAHLAGAAILVIGFFTAIVDEL
jgi:hypothetical protein